MKSIPIYYMIYEPHYFNCWERGNAAESKRENYQEAGQDVLGPQSGCSDRGRPDLMAFAPKIHPCVGREGPDLKGSSEIES